jgi:signal peptidase I
MSGRSIALVAAGLTAMVATRLWGVTPVQVSSDSMSPTISTGDTVLVERISTHWRTWHRGDVVTFRSPEDGQSALKRIVALSGDRLAIEDAVLVVNGRPVAEPYADRSHVDGLYVGPLTVPTGRLYLLGDSRNGSIDSRVYGAVPADAVTGRMLLRWSW